jgi:uncharacterized protein
MSRIVVFGACGRAGRQAVLEAVARGHQVTAVVRDPAQHLAEGASLVAGDVTDADSVAAVSAGHDAAINAAGRTDVSPEQFFVDSAHALVNGLARAGVGRLLVIGIGTMLEASPGVALYETPGFPPEARDFSVGHAAELEVFRAVVTGLDWLMIAPPPVFLSEEPRTGRYRIGGGQVLPADGFSYADLAVALIDEIDKPEHHRALVAVAP